MIPCVCYEGKNFVNSFAFRWYNPDEIIEGMLEVLCVGRFTNGGLNFDAKTRRGSCTSEDIAHAYIADMDAHTLRLRIASANRTDGTLDVFFGEH